MLKQNSLTALVLITLTLALTSCLFEPKDASTDEPKDASTGEPAYSAQIVWESDTCSSHEISLMLDGDALYTFESNEPSGHPYYEWLTKLDAQTGAVLWRSEERLKGWLQQCQPVVLGEYVYAFISADLIYRFNKENGALSSITKVAIDNQPLEINDNVIGYGSYIYFGIGEGRVNNYFVRIDLNTIQGSEDPHEIRLITPEIVWRPKTDRSISSVPAIKDNVIYVHTFAGDSFLVELAGINMDTKEVVFYDTFGTRDDGTPFENSIMPQTQKQG